MADVASYLTRLAPIPEADFREFGEVEIQPLTKIQQFTANFLGRNWVTIPHVTHNDEVDVTDLEMRRGAWNADHPDGKLTPVVLLVKALAEVLAVHPNFNSSLSADGRSIIRKRYVNIGVAVDTANGLLVPVIRDVRTKSLAEIARELSAISAKARTKGLSMAEMSGGSMTVTSLGHIGGTAFTPIINAPEVAILGALPIGLRPAPAEDGGVAWRKVLPLSLSYDHRVINGADAARFVRSLGAKLQEANLFAQDAAGAHAG